MFRKFLIFAVAAGSSASVPSLYEAHPETFQKLLRLVVARDETPRPAIELNNLQAEADHARQPSGRRVVVSADARGHFVSAFRINGSQIDAMIDTGATLVALNTSTARRAGIALAPSDFSEQVETANGTVKVAVVEIRRLEIGRIALNDVRAVVLDDRALRTNLIGMSFLKRLGKYEVNEGSLTLTQ